MCQCFKERRIEMHDLVSREKIARIPHKFLPYRVSRTMFTLFESRIPRNCVSNPVSRRQKRSNPASREILCLESLLYTVK